MLAVISPAKTINFSKTAEKRDYSVPYFLEEAQVLVKILKKLKPLDLSYLMGISAKLADLNFERFLRWEKNHSLENSKQAVYAFDGDVYNGIDIESIPNKNIRFLNRNVRILSGLYGVLNPLDLIMEYRLEMGSKLKNKNGKDLYAFWGTKITQNINEAIEKSEGEKILINLASNEYYKAIHSKLLKYPVITPVFKEYKDGEYQIISFFAKKARGLMIRFITLENITKSEQIKFFNLGNYAYNEELSKGNLWVFTR